MPGRARLRRIVIRHDDGSGSLGPRGTRSPNIVEFASGWADVVPGSGTDQLGLGSRLQPEQTISIRGFRPSTTSRIKPGMLVVWDERAWEIFSVNPVLRGAPGEVDILALDKNTARVS